MVLSVSYGCSVIVLRHSGLGDGRSAVDFRSCSITVSSPFLARAGSGVAPHIWFVRRAGILHTEQNFWCCANHDLSVRCNVMKFRSM